MGKRGRPRKNQTPTYSRNEDEFNLYKKQAIKAAEDFHYGDDVVTQIKEAKTENEISHIMGTARANKKW